MLKQKSFFITVLKWLPALFIISCSFYLSSLPKIEKMPSFWNADKLVHCICFAGLAFWVEFAVFSKEKITFSIIFAILFVCVYGIIDEIHQSFTPGRSASVFDWIADSLGAAIGSFLYLLARKLCHV